MPLATVSSCSFANADFSGATMVIMGGFAPAPGGGEMAGLGSVSLNGANLTGTVLDQSCATLDLRGATVTGASFKFVCLGGVQADAVDFSQDDLDQSNGWGGSMPNTKFTQANLQHVTWHSIDLSGADFTGADLTGASLSGSTLTGVVWNNTTCPDGTNSSLYAPQTCVGHGV
jgi:uncharacterized protein YjbI with pentapeptide repeats